MVPSHDLSEETIYKRALPIDLRETRDDSEGDSNRRFSLVKYNDKVNKSQTQRDSSEEEFVNTSDELDKIIDSELPVRFVTECTVDDWRGARPKQTNTSARLQTTFPTARPGPSGPGYVNDQMMDQREEKATQKIRETKAAKAKMYKPPGEYVHGYNFDLS